MTFRHLRIHCAYLLNALVLVACSTVQPLRSDNNALTVADWQDNIEFVAQALKRHHPDPFAYSDEKTFDQHLDSLRERLPFLDDHEVLVRLIGAVASLRDGHTALRGGFSFLSGQYPFRFYAFTDGLHVTAAQDVHQPLIGARLISINGHSAEDALVRVSTITPHDNQMTQLNRAPAFLSLPETLHALGLASSLQRGNFVFRERNGAVLSLEMVPVSFEERLYWGDDATAADRPLRRQRRGRNYWSEYLEDYEVLYVQFNRVRNEEDQSIAEFAAAQSAFEERVSPNCVLLDIRDNGGGNGYFNPPLVTWAARSPSARQGRFFVAIGRATFSAAQKLATALEAQSNATFIGEPTGSRPNHFGDSESFPLPHGDLTLSVSSRYWEDAGPGDLRDALEPDITVAETAQDYFSFNDPVLAEVIDRCR